MEWTVHRMVLLTSTKPYQEKGRWQNRNWITCMRAYQFPDFPFLNRTRIIQKALHNWQRGKVSVTAIYLKLKYYILNSDEYYKKTIQKNPNPSPLTEMSCFCFSVVLSFMALANGTKLTCSISWFNTGCQTIERTTNGNARPQRNFNGTWTKQVSYTFHRLFMQRVMGKHVANFALTSIF